MKYMILMVGLGLVLATIILIGIAVTVAGAISRRRRASQDGAVIAESGLDHEIDVGSRSPLDP